MSEQLRLSPKELQELKVEVLATLPRHIWHLRDGYNDIKDELGKPQVPVERGATVERGASPQSVVWEGLIDLVAQLQGNLLHISAKGNPSIIRRTLDEKKVMTIMSRIARIFISSNSF